MKFKRYPFLITIVFIISVAIAKQNTGCHDSPRYLIIDGSMNKGNSSFLVKYKSDETEKLDCDYVKQEGDFEIGNGRAEFFFAIRDNFLLIDQGTGPEPRGLIIWDLDSREKVYSGGYSSPYQILSDHMSFWQPTQVQANRQNCPELESYRKTGFGVALEQKVTLNFKDMTLDKNSLWRCNSRQ